jgi:hypothetical protein
MSNARDEIVTPRSGPARLRDVANHVALPGMPDGRP